MRRVTTAYVTSLLILSAIALIVGAVGPKTLSIVFFVTAFILFLAAIVLLWIGIVVRIRRLRGQQRR